MRFDGTNLKEVRAQARQGRIFAVVWTPRQHRIVKTMIEGRRQMAAWRERYEADGWECRSGALGNSVFATSPADGSTHGISLDEYDAETLERVLRVPKQPKPRDPLAAKPAKRGRKPIGV